MLTDARIKVKHKLKKQSPSRRLSPRVKKSRDVNNSQLNPSSLHKALAAQYKSMEPTSTVNKENGITLKRNFSKTQSRFLFEENAVVDLNIHQFANRTLRTGGNDTILISNGSSRPLTDADGNVLHQFNAVSTSSRDHAYAALPSQVMEKKSSFKSSRQSVPAVLKRT